MFQGIPLSGMFLKQCFVVHIERRSVPIRGAPGNKGVFIKDLTNTAAFSLHLAEVGFSGGRGMTGRTTWSHGAGSSG